MKTTLRLFGSRLCTSEIQLIREVQTPMICYTLDFHSVPLRGLEHSHICAHTSLPYVSASINTDPQLL